MAVPTYDRRRLAPAVVHIGVGGFHRAHQAVYLDELAQRRVSMDWGIVGVGLRSGRMRAALAPQDHLYTVVQRGSDGDDVRVVGAMRGCLWAGEQREAVLEALASERTRLVTITVTGGGYHVDPGTGELAASDMEILHDARRPAEPVTLPGFLVEALDRRRRRGSAPFTVLSCDNVPGNGAVAKAAVTGLATLRDPALAAWIEANVAFPDSMVDRITPATTPEARRSLAEEHGVSDRWPVVTERFSQWIVQDEFSAGRPPLEEVGVELVADVAPYEAVKKRLLNGTHCAIAFLGRLAGHETTADVMADPLLARFVTRMMDEEIAPALPRVAGWCVSDYARSVRERLSNTAIGDQLSRLSARSGTKMPAYLIPSLADARAAGRPAPLLTLAVAAWLHVEGGDVPGAMLRDRRLFGPLAGDPELALDVRAALRSLRARSVARAIEALPSATLPLAA